MRIRLLVLQRFELLRGMKKRRTRRGTKSVAADTAQAICTTKTKLFPPGWLKLREICLYFRRLCVVVWGCFEAPQISVKT